MPEMTYDFCVKKAQEHLESAVRFAQDNFHNQSQTQAAISQAYSQLAMTMPFPEETQVSFQVDSDGKQVFLNREMLDRLRRGEEVIIGPGVLDDE